MRNKIDFFLPTRKGSQRVINKNTKPFANIEGGILELKLRQLLNSKRIDRVLLSTNDEESIKIAHSIDPNSCKINVIVRPEYLCLDTTNLVDLINYVPTITNADHILWGHVTTPFADASDYDNAIDVYFEKINNGFDSLVSVTPFKNFLFNKAGEIINNSSNIKWPRTQDLTPLLELNHAMFITSKIIYEQKNNRVGDKPYFHEMEKLKSIDIDWEDDFKIAEMIYEKFITV